MTNEHDRQVLNKILNPLFPDLVDDLAENATDSADAQTQLTPAQLETRRLEIAGVKSAENGRFDEAVTLFGRAIELNPTSASAYNNRAQAHRLLMKIEDARSDLNKALELSNGKGKVAAQAYTQRAMIHRLQGNNDEAKRDYELAASQGCVFAKNQLIMMNPYAAMCNKMLAAAIGKLQRGETDETETAA